MIRLVKRKDLEIEKYDGCIAVSAQSRIYAFSWYLDIVAENWDVLVLGDYEVVMPLPWKQKYFIKYITQPFFCQQLGVFSKENLSEKLQEKMIQQIPKKFVKIALNFNSDNFLNSKMKPKRNYLLKIEKTYEENYKKFNNNRKRGLKKAENSFLYIKEVEFDCLELIAYSNYSHLNYSHLDYEKLKKLIHVLKNKENGILLGVFNREKTIIGGVLFLKDAHRLTYLFSVMNVEAKKINAATFLLSRVIKQYENQNLLLDFEGSMNIGISNFFKSFGGINENYYQLKINAFKRIFF